MQESTHAICPLHAIDSDIWLTRSIDSRAPAPFQWCKPADRPKCLAIGLTFWTPVAEVFKLLTSGEDALIHDSV